MLENKPSLSSDVRASGNAIPVGRLISAAGFTTALGGGGLPEPVRRAMDEGASSTYRPDDLQAWAGEVIAGATGAESGWVTAGAAAGLTLAAAACIAGTRRADIDRLPATDGMAAEIGSSAATGTRTTGRSAPPGRASWRSATPTSRASAQTFEWQLEAAFSDRTVAVAHLELADGLGVPLERVCACASAHGIPVIVDAAAELPPVDNLRQAIRAGAALVAFSGGKAIRGPQGSGILAGRRDLIESVRLQTLDMDVDVPWWVELEGSEPPHHGLGRSMKVGKEQIVGAAVALQHFVGRDHEAEAGEHAVWLESLVASTVGLGDASVRRDLSLLPKARRLGPRRRGCPAVRGDARGRAAADRRAARAARGAESS